ncbi:MAG TPA: 5'-nucleotidase, partial [Myxococcales bacterium]|nr:5'-nucleotidase [Myxococcales bacterium]
PTGTVTNTAISCPATACPDASWACTGGRCVQTVKAPDPGAAALLQPYRDQLSTVYDTKVARTAGIFTRDGSAERVREVPIGDLLADAMLDRYRQSDGAQIAFTNGGGIRASLPSSWVVKDTSLTRIGCSAGTPCDVVTGDIYTVLPFGNVAVIRRITGQLLWQVLEYSVGAIPSVNGRFLQIAGFKFEYSAGVAPGSRIQRVYLLDPQGATIKEIAKDDTTEYVVVTNDFTAGGGDGYSMLVQTPAAPGREVLADVFLGYVRGRAVISPTDYPASTRIIQNP